MTKLSTYLVSCLFLSTSNLLFSVNAFADNQTALIAQQNGDYQAAARMWQEMANDGDVIAQFNLSLLYQSGTGVNQDQNLARYWMTMAARQGLALAYQKLNAKSVRPSEAPISVQQLVTNPQAWLIAQNPANYTLQLASSTNRDLIQKYFEENHLQGKAGYYSSMRQGERWYALVYGSYASVNQAKEAISDLPQDLRKWSPWVRNINSIHKIMIKE
jgi:septal ring-binding cell division protein DamX